MHVRLVPAVLATGALVATLAGCGANDSADSYAATKPATIVNDARAALTSASSLHARGVTGTGASQVVLDVNIAGRDHAKANATYGDGATLAVVRDGNQLYVHGSEAYWKRYSQLPAGPMSAIWVRSPVSGQSRFGALASISDPTRLFASFQSSGKLTSTGTSTVDGTTVVGVRDAHGNVLYVDTSDGHRPVELDVKGGTAETVRFDKFGEELSISAPQHSVPEDQMLSYAASS